MGLLKRAADLTYAFRFIRMLVLDWQNGDPHKVGIIDQDGNRDRIVKMATAANKSASTRFFRVGSNI